MKALTKHAPDTNIRELIVKTSEQIRDINFNQLKEMVSSLEQIKNHMEMMDRQQERKHFAIVDCYAPQTNSTLPEVPGDNRILYFSGKY